MIEKMKQCKFLLMLLMLFIGMGAYAQNVDDSKNIFTETFDKMKAKAATTAILTYWALSSATCLLTTATTPDGATRVEATARPTSVCV